LDNAVDVCHTAVVYCKNSRE